MAGRSQGAGTGPRDRMALTVVLIIVGLGGLATQLLRFNADVGGLVVAVIGLRFLVAFTLRRRYGFFIEGLAALRYATGLLAVPFYLLAGVRQYRLGRP